MDFARKLFIKRRNIEYVLQYCNVIPFLWYKSKYICFYCNEPMKDLDSLRQHTPSHRNTNLELVVFDRTKSKRNKDAAIKIDVPNDIKCKLCSETSNSLKEFIQHIIIAHDAEYDVSIPNCFLPFKLNREQPICGTCNEKFVSFEYLLRHANKNHLSHQYICDVCGVSFQGQVHLRMHYRYYHREGGYTCKLCDVSFDTLAKMMQHEKNAHDVKLSSCPHCTEVFKSPYVKKLHMANVHGVEEMKIKCPHCPKVYPQESIMSRHMRRVHLREKNVECEVCGDKFFGPYELKLHMLKHNGDKNFACSVCGKKFSKKCNLNAHMGLHKREKKICSICDKHFSSDKDLKEHSKSHEEIEVGNILDDIADNSMGEIIEDVTEIQMEVIHDGIDDAGVTIDEYIIT